MKKFFALILTFMILGCTTTSSEAKEVGSYQPKPCGYSFFRTYDDTPTYLCVSMVISGNSRIPQLFIGASKDAMKLVRDARVTYPKDAFMVFEVGTNKLVVNGSESTWNGDLIEVLYDDWTLSQVGDVVRASQPDPPAVSLENLVSMAQALKDRNIPSFVLKDDSWCPNGTERELPNMCSKMPKEALCIVGSVRHHGMAWYAVDIDGKTYSWPECDNEQ